MGSVATIRSGLAGSIAILLCGSALAFSTATAADAGEFRHSSGLRFRYPDDWFPLSKETFDELRPHMPAGVRTWIDQNKIDLDRTAACVVHFKQDDFPENLNIVIEPQAIPIKQESVAMLLQTMPRLFGQMGLKIGKIEAKIAEVGDDTAIVAEYEFQVPGSSLPMRQRQVHFAGDGKSFIVTCTAAAHSFDQESPAFDAILTSMEIPAAKKSELPWKLILLSAGIGAVLATALGVISWFVLRKESRGAGGESPSEMPNA